MNDDVSFPTNVVTLAVRHIVRAADEIDASALFSTDLSKSMVSFPEEVMCAANLVTTEG